MPKILEFDTQRARPRLSGGPAVVYSFEEDRYVAPFSRLDRYLGIGMTAAMLLVMSPSHRQMPFTYVRRAEAVRIQNES